MKKQIWKSMWMCLCIAFGCWMLAFTGNVQVHAADNNDVSIGESDTKSKDVEKSNKNDVNTESSDKKNTGKDAAKDTDAIKQNDQGVYEIDSYAKLKQFATVVTEGNTYANAKLTADIECKNADGTSVTDWTPIGDSSLENESIHGYKGTFDGQGHTITGLNNTDNPTELGGLFSAINTEGTVKNVVLKDAKLKGKYRVGGITGLNSGIVQNCCNIGGTIGVFDNSDEHASVDVGGVVGLSNNGKVENCYNTGNITVSGRSLFFSVGGVIGYNTVNVQNCYNTGNISATDFTSGFLVGGVLGFSSGTVKNCYNTGNINVSSTSTLEGFGVAGVVGSNYGVLQNCYNAGNISVKPNSPTKETFIGGVAGESGVEGYADGIELNCYYDSSICKVDKAIGAEDDTTTGKLTTAQMTGTDALENMKGFSGTDVSNVWLTKADAKDGDNDYWFYPHLKGFNMKADGNQQMDPADIKASEWPPKVKVSVVLNETKPYVYNGKDQSSKMTNVIVGDDLVLEEGKDYTAVYQQQNGTEWKDVKACVNAGTYKVVISFKTSGHANIEKKFVIDPAPLTITADNASKVYDGTVLLKDSYTSAGLVSGDKIASVKITGSQTAIGSSSNVPSAAVIKNAAGEDVTSNYNITYTNGKLVVENKPLTITADSASKVYDGTVLLKDSYTSTDLASGDKIASVKITGSQTAIGSSSNVPSAAVIKNAAGEDVTANYDIKYVNGELTVTKQSVDSNKADEAEKANEANEANKADEANDNTVSADTHSNGTSYANEGESEIYKTSDMVLARDLLGLELLMMLSIVGLLFLRRKKKI